MLATPNKTPTPGGAVKDGWVYLIHFERPFHHASHYLGWSNDLEKRMKEHREGKGSRLMKAVTEAQIPWRLVRVEKGSRALEARWKKRHNTPKLCPLCVRKSK